MIEFSHFRYRLKKRKSDVGQLTGVRIPLSPPTKGPPVGGLCWRKKTVRLTVYGGRARTRRASVRPVAEGGCPHPADDAGTGAQRGVNPKPGWVEIHWYPANAFYWRRERFESQNRWQAGAPKDALRPRDQRRKRFARRELESSAIKVPKPESDGPLLCRPGSPLIPAFTET